MSTDSVRNRLLEAAKGKWSLELETGPQGQQYGQVIARHTTSTTHEETWVCEVKEFPPCGPNGRLLVHAPVDLALALDVIEAATIVSELGRKGLPSDGALTRFDVALAAFEAAP